jgi:hypothetical protein
MNEENNRAGHQPSVAKAVEQAAHPIAFIPILNAMK